MVRLLAFGLAVAVLSGCSSSGEGSDASTTDSASDAPATTTGPCDGGTGVGFTYHYGTSASHTACLPLPNDIRVVYLKPDAGCSSLNQTAAFGANTDQSLTMNVRAQFTELFADAGATSVFLDFTDKSVCPDTGTCAISYSPPTASCAFHVDVPGHAGDVVSGSLTAPCTLPVMPASAQPSDVTVDSLDVAGTLVANCP